MDAARLNEKIYIYSVTYTNNVGDMIPSETLITETMATRTSKSITNSEGLVSEVVNFFMRWDYRIDYNCKIYHENQAYKVITINKVGRKEALSIDTIRIENQ